MKQEMDKGGGWSDDGCDGFQVNVHSEEQR